MLKKIMTKVKGFVTDSIEKVLAKIKHYGEVVVVMVKSLVLGVSPEKIIFAKTLGKLGLA